MVPMVPVSLPCLELMEWWLYGAGTTAEFEWQAFCFYEKGGGRKRRGSFDLDSVDPHCRPAG
jgi:hypothetical protein